MTDDPMTQILENFRLLKESIDMLKESTEGTAAALEILHERVKALEDAVYED